MSTEALVRGFIVLSLIIAASARNHSSSYSLTIDSKSQALIPFCKDGSFLVHDLDVYATVTNANIWPFQRPWNLEIISGSVCKGLKHPLLKPLDESDGVTSVVHGSMLKDDGQVHYHAYDQPQASSMCVRIRPIHQLSPSAPIWAWYNTIQVRTQVTGTTAMFWTYVTSSLVACMVATVGLKAIKKFGERRRNRKLFKESLAAQAAIAVANEDAAPQDPHADAPALAQTMKLADVQSVLDGAAAGNEGGAIIKPIPPQWEHGEGNCDHLHDEADEDFLVLRSASL